MRNFLKILLARLFPDVNLDAQVHFTVLDGRQDLERMLAERIAAWKTPGTNFLIIRDQDWDDCRIVKARLAQRVADVRQDQAVIVRIACRCLESFYLGSAALMSQEYKDSALKKKILRLGDPDQVDRPAQWLEQSVTGFKKSDAARRMAARLPIIPDPELNGSHSYRHLLRSLLRLDLQS